MMDNGLYSGSYEHDACGVGMVVNIQKRTEKRNKGYKMKFNVISRENVVYKIIELEYCGVLYRIFEVQHNANLLTHHVCNINGSINENLADEILDLYHREYQPFQNL